MLYLLEFIKSHENWEDLLTKDPYNLKISRDSGYILFKYNQLCSDFSLPEVREARGIIFKEADWTCVCHAFDKFGNYGESYCPEIDWSTASVQEKVDGCFSKKDKVLLADGSSIPISEIVNNKLDCEVLSYNFKTNKIEPKRVIGWNKKSNGVGGINHKEWLTLKLKGVTQKLACKKSPHSILTLTKNHQIFVKNGSDIIEKAAGDLTVDDILLTPTEQLSYIEKQVSLGTLLGDGSLTYCKNIFCSSGLIFSHSLKQQEYATWKASLLHNFTPHVQISTNVNSYGKTRIRVNTNVSQKFTKIKNLCYNNGKKKVTVEWLKQLDFLGFAIWYMDDGYLNTSSKNNAIGLSTEGFSLEEVELIINFFKENNIVSYIKAYRGLYGITISTESSEKIWQQIRKYIPECMQYKLPERHRGYYDPTFINNDIKYTPDLVPAYIESIEEGMNRKAIYGTAKYDIEVEDNHNYFCGGVLVHNSLMKVWFDDTWHISTNGTIDAFKALLACADKEIASYGDLFLYCLNTNKHPFSFKSFTSFLDEEYCYMFEMVSPYNRVVIEYNEPKLYYLGCRNLDLHFEESYVEFNPFKNALGCLLDTPKIYPLHTLKEVQEAANALPWNEEGYVVVDANFNRVKIKSPEYVLAHHGRTNGNVSDSRLLEIILNNEVDEFVIYASEYTDKINNLIAAMETFKTQVKLEITKLSPANYSSRKEYAEAVKKYPSHMQYFLFRYENVDEELNKISISGWKKILSERGII